jgi:hypothetical protein
MIHVPDMGCIVDSGIELSFWPASLCSLTGQNDRQPYVTVDFIPQSGTMNSATAAASHLIIHGSYYS